MRREATAHPSAGSRAGAACIAAILAALLTAGCSSMERAAVKTPAPAETTPATTTAPVAGSSAPSTSGGADHGTIKIESPASQPSARAPRTPAPTTAPAKKAGAAGPVKPAAAPPLDLTALEKSLRETEAIGVFTKIALKNQVDDLLQQFRAYYQGKAKTTLAELRQPYEMLLLKVLSLVQDRDPKLAQSILASREAIWGILSDPAKFATL
jgi:hypothetical protein